MSVSEREKLFTTYVGHIHMDVTENDLVALFTTVGTVRYCYLQPIPDNREFTFGFVGYKTQEEALQAIQHLSGWLLRSHRIIVDVADDNRDRFCFDFAAHWTLMSGVVCGVAVRSVLLNVTPTLSPHIGVLLCDLNTFGDANAPESSQTFSSEPSVEITTPFDSVQQQESSDDFVDSLYNLHRVQESCLWLNSEQTATNCTGIINTGRILRDVFASGCASKVPDVKCGLSERCHFSPTSVQQELQKWLHGYSLIPGPPLECGILS